jgi:membrane-bound lytic murein transglycosylase B
MPPRRTLLLVGSIAVVIVVAVIIVALAPRPVPEALPTPGPTYAPPATPPALATKPASASIADLVSRDWLEATAERTGIPLRALAAYAGAAVAEQARKPTCGVSWNTLAAIGWVESRHGSFRGSTIAADGAVRPGIYGVALDGATTAHIPDSDNGKYDNDKKYDRAIGPMQMIPQTWRNWRTDASGDGRMDPQNIDDEVMAAANYLCRASPDMVGVDGWQQGIASYNSAPSYLVSVARAAIDYAG